jgi:hypothetical protein
VNGTRGRLKGRRKRELGTGGNTRIEGIQKRRGRYGKRGGIFERKKITYIL